MRKRLILLTLAFLFTNIAANGDALPDEQWTKSGPPTNQASIGIMQTTSESKQVNSFLIAFKQVNDRDTQSRVNAVKLCKSYKSDTCFTQGHAKYMAVLGACSTPKDVDCISGIHVENERGESLEVSDPIDFKATNSGEFVGDPKLNLPSGKSTFLVDVPSAPHRGGTKYLIAASIYGLRNTGNEKFEVNTFDVEIDPVEIVSGKYQLREISTELSDYVNGVQGAARGGSFQCVQLTESQCAIKHRFPTGLNFEISLKLRTQITGWFHGRISKVNANIQRDKSGNQLISVKASPVVSPTVFGWAKVTDLSSDLKKFYAQMPVSKLKQGNGFGCTVFPETNCNNLNWLSTLRGAEYSESGMVELNLWIKFLKDKATVAPTFWNFKNMEFGTFSNCPQSKKDLIGIVSTNSTGYISGPPTFNSKTRSLDYKVLSPHYLADDSVFIGSYDLVINSELARCLYDFSDAPIQASISIIKEDGVSTVATTSIMEKNGYLHLGAYGFTFSNPTLRVKLTQKKNQKYTITCKKGSTSESVTGTAPKCPSGFKKVA